MSLSRTLYSCTNEHQPNSCSEQRYYSFHFSELSLRCLCFKPFKRSCPPPWAARPGGAGSTCGIFITSSLFLAVLSRHQRPSLCSWPSPATTHPHPPHSLMLRLLMKPNRAILFSSVRLLNPSLTCQTRSRPSWEF